MFADPVDLVTDRDFFDEELRHFMDDRPFIGSSQRVNYVNQIFPEVAEPMCEAWDFWEKHKRLKKISTDSSSSEIALSHALSAARRIKAPDWRVACYEWLDRRQTMQYDLKFNIFAEEWGCSNAQKPSPKKEE